jgi:hypothetical protein
MINLKIKNYDFLQSWKQSVKNQINFFQKIRNYSESKKDNPSKKNYLVYIVISIVISSFIIIIFQNPAPQYDSWVYYYKTLDVMNYQINLLENFSEYVDNIINSNLIVYYWISLLIPFKTDLMFQNTVLTYIMPIIQILVFVILIYFISSKILKTNSILNLLIFFAGYHLNTWIPFSLPSSISLIFILLMIVNILSDNQKNKYLGGIFYIAIALFHRTTFILVTINFLFIYGKPMVKTIHSFVNEFFNRNSDAKIFNQSVKRIKIFVFIGVLFIIILAFFLLWPYISPLLFSIINSLSQLFDKSVFFSRYNTPSLIFWLIELSGPFLLGFSIYLLKIFKRSEGQKIVNREIVKYFGIFLAFNVIICILLPVWAFISLMPYLYYRYFIFIDFSMIFVVPVAYEILKKKIKQNSSKITEINRKILKFILVGFWIQIVIFSGIHISSNFFNGYYNSFIPEEYIETYQTAREFNPDSIYMILPHPISFSRNMYSKSIHYDRYIIDYEESRSYFNFFTNDSTSNDENFVIFKDYLINGTKSLRSNGRTISENKFSTLNPVEYMIIDTYNNTILYDLIKNDSIFDEIFFREVEGEKYLSMYNITAVNYNISIFRIST